MAKKGAIFLAFALSSLLVSAQDSRGGLIEGDGWAFLVSAPEGWVWDGETLRIHGIRGLFYKAGTSYSPSALHIYISPAPKTAASLAQFMKDDEASFMKATAGIRLKDLPPFVAGPGYRFELRDFDDSNGNYYQTIGYFEGEVAYFIFVLSCRSPEEREAARPDFIELLDSFTYVKKEKP